jgi:hypothetical protein
MIIQYNKTILQEDACHVYRKLTLKCQSRVVPTHITRVLIMGGGWDYTGRADNIELIITPVLFSVAVEAQSELNNEDISEALRQEFEDYNISLSDDAAVSVKETDREWLITDDGKTYAVKRQGDRLKIYMNP